MATAVEHAQRDTAVRGILVSNVLTLVFALVQDWPLALLLWPYWIQSLVIGWYARERILALRKFSTEGFTSNGRPVPANEEGKRSTANFFALHYGFFHLGYLVFLLQMSLGEHAISRLDWLLVAGLGVSFWLTHRASHRLNLAADLAGERNLGSLMFLPYARVVPMHLTIILGAALQGSGLAALIFVPLKTAADVLMHKIEHRWLRAGRRAAPAGPTP